MPIEALVLVLTVATFVLAFRWSGGSGAGGAVALLRSRACPAVRITLLICGVEGW